MDRRYLSLSQSLSLSPPLPLSTTGLLVSTKKQEKISDRDSAFSLSSTYTSYPAVKTTQWYPRRPILPACLHRPKQDTSKRKSNEQENIRSANNPPPTPTPTPAHPHTATARRGGGSSQAFFFPAWRRWGAIATDTSDVNRKKHARKVVVRLRPCMCCKKQCVSHLGLVTDCTRASLCVKSLRGAASST